MAQFYLKCNAGTDAIKFKSLKFKVQNLEKASALLAQIKQRNPYVFKVQIEFHRDDNKIYLWRVSRLWYQTTGMLMPNLKDVRETIMSR